MSIAQIQKTCKAWLGKIPIEVLVLILVILSSFVSFLLGNSMGREARTTAASIVPVELIFAPSEPSHSGEGRDAPMPIYTVGETAGVSGAFVASKNGSKYYAPWCGTVSRIKEENKVWFATEAEAVAAGFGKAANCKF